MPDTTSNTTTQAPVLDAETIRLKKELEQKEQALKSLVEQARTTAPATHGQAPGTGTNATPGTTTEITELARDAIWLPKHSIEISTGIFWFALLTLGLIGALLFSGKVKAPENDGQWLLRIIVVPVCVFAAVLLVVAGFSSTQISPAVGLLGTIIGYLLGAATRPAAPVPPVAPPPGH
jgi:hypothetical protein